MSLVSLNTLSVGEQAYVNKLGFGANDRRRMQDIGLIWISGTMSDRIVPESQGP